MSNIFLLIALSDMRFHLFPGKFRPVMLLQIITLETETHLSYNHRAYILKVVKE